jgi:hypothetical protein
MTTYTALVRSAFFVALVTSSISITPAFAQSAQGKSKAGALSTETRQIPVKKVFGFYDQYLALPPEGRDGFALTYKLSGAGAVSRPQAYFVQNTTRVPLQLSPTGVVLNMPNAAMYANGMLEIPAGSPRTSVGLDLQPVVALSRSISVAAATNPIADYAAAIRRTGPLALVAPKLTGLRFVGVSNGEVIFSDGRRAALPAAPEGGVVFRPALPAMRGATSLSFATTPTSAEFAR